MLSKSNKKTFVFHTSDKFGEYGITAVVSIDEYFGLGEVEIIDFIMSCRVMGKQIEESILYFITRHYIEKGISTFKAQVNQTRRNLPFIEFIQQKCLASNNIYIDVSSLNLPGFIKLQRC